MAIKKKKKMSNINMRVKEKRGDDPPLFCNGDKPDDSAYLLNVRFVLLRRGRSAEGLLDEDGACIVLLEVFLRVETTDAMLITFLPVSRKRTYGSPMAPRCLRSCSLS
jgi:hypothetical protein